MKSHHTETEIACDGALMAQIERLVAAKVAEKLDAVPANVPGRSAAVREPQTSNRASIVVFSSDLDKVMAAFVIATGAAAMGIDVTMYFTFWGLSAIRKATSIGHKGFAEKLMSLVLPRGPAALGTSKRNMFGIGPAFFKSVMRRKNIQALPDLIELARETGVRLVACQMSMDLMGITGEELMDDIHYGGVATYIADARDCGITLFI